MKQAAGRATQWWTSPYKRMKLSQGFRCDPEARRQVVRPLTGAWCDLVGRQAHHAVTGTVCSLFHTVPPVKVPTTTKTGSAMNRLREEGKLAVVSALVEGASIRSVERMTGVHRDTIMRLLLRVGKGCAKLLNEKMRDLDLHSLQCDEIWTYVAKKQKQVRPSDNGEVGDQYVFVALDAKTKLVPSFLVGKRELPTAERFIMDLRRRLNGRRVHLTTDAYSPYVIAVGKALGRT